MDDPATSMLSDNEEGFETACERIVVSKKGHNRIEASKTINYEEEEKNDISHISTELSQIAPHSY